LPVVFRALIVDDEETYARSMKRLLLRRGVQCDHAATCADGLAKVRKRTYDLVLLDFLLPDGSGLDLIPPIRALKGANPAPQVLMMTAFGTIENAVEAMRRGAFDYVTKSTAIDTIVERVLDARRIAEARTLTRPADDSIVAAHEGLLGDSTEIKEARRRIVEVANAPGTTVLLTGESGTGKGIAARAIHASSREARGEPFVAIDCVALPPTLAESELFGHEKGAFTGADRAKPGKLELAARGTVLLDEIGDMELSLQGKLLRVLEERTFERVGGVKALELSARVVAASHRDLAARVEEGRFRLDLYHRLSVFPINIPPLRARGDDVVLLADHFVREFSDRLGKPLQPLAPTVREALMGYDFPGNVRELRNVIERAAILATGNEITVELLPPRLLSTPRALPVGGKGGLTVEFRPGTDTLDGLERRLLEEALRLADGKKSRAAELLGISRFALLRRVEKYGLE
jgi:two-component system NtrC family response regulator